MSEIDLPSFPFPHDHLTPSPAYAERRASCPLGRVRLPSGHAAVLLVTHPDIAAALADSRLSHTVTGPDAPRSTVQPSFFNDPRSMNTMDGEPHLRIRRIVASAFTPRAVDRRRPAMEQAAAGLLDTMERAGAPTDLIADYCFPLPVLIICRLLGVPERDALRFRDWSTAFLSAADMSVEERMGRIGEFAAYIAGLLARHRATPGTDLVDDLIAARDGSDRLSEDELAYLTTSLIAGGNETTANSLGRAVLALLSEGREAWEQLVADPSLIPAAVNELLRHNVLGPGASLRIATEDVALPSGTITAGEVVAIVGVSGQHDEQVYPEPERLRFDRTTPAELAFGGGPHYCLGAHLAKAELQIGLRLLIERFPKLRLTVDPADLRFTDGEILSSLIELPVSW
ncbi:cytochrome P450 [Catenulispora sp. MAP5-51]|uniref:cytochrome P450 n=1 Tax=Catenulispora sp. MAP5-51 TaxID=3156298 RepID=UPI003511B133